MKKINIAKETKKLLKVLESNDVPCWTEPEELESYLEDVYLKTQNKITAEQLALIRQVVDGYLVKIGYDTK